MTQIQMPKTETSNFKIPKKRKQKNTYRIISTGWNDKKSRRVRDSPCVFFPSSIHKRKKEDRQKEAIELEQSIPLHSAEKKRTME